MEISVIIHALLLMLFALISKTLFFNQAQSSISEYGIDGTISFWDTSGVTDIYSFLKLGDYNAECCKSCWYDWHVIASIKLQPKVEYRKSYQDECYVFSFGTSR